MRLIQYGRINLTEKDDIPAGFGVRVGTGTVEGADKGTDADADGVNVRESLAQALYCFITFSIPSVWVRMVWCHSNH